VVDLTLLHLDRILLPELKQPTLASLSKYKVSCLNVLHILILGQLQKGQFTKNISLSFLVILGKG